MKKSQQLHQSQQFVFFIYDNNRSNFSQVQLERYPPREDVDYLFYQSIKTLRKHSAATIVVYITETVNTQPIEDIPNIEIQYFKTEDWAGKRMFYRLQTASKYPWKDGDQVIIADTDLLFNDDPFKIFNENQNFDVFYTKRYDPKHFPINEGLSGYRWNKEKMSKYFNFWLKQATLFKAATWKPYRNNLIKHGATSTDWQVGQIFLCTIHQERNKPNFPLKYMKFYDADCRWNYFLTIKKMKTAASKGKMKVFHMKGGPLKKRKNVDNILRLFRK